MKGLEISRGYYEEYGSPMLKNDFPDLLGHIAVGFVGSGSEHFGFDDDVSCDHDFEPGFCIFLPGEDIVDRRRAFQLERAYSKLPKEYMGVSRTLVSPVGGNRNGVLRTSEFYENAAGTPNGDLSTQAWLHIPDSALAEATNGEVFYDGCGEFTAIREKLKNMPRDIKLKRIAGNILLMAQSGQYNFVRCLMHGEPEAAQLAIVEFVNAAMKTTFLLKDMYMPFYKWSFRALRENAHEEELAEKLSFLLTGDNSETLVADVKYETIEEISGQLIAELRRRKLTEANCDDLEKHAYSVNDQISDGNIRNMHILTAV